MRCDGAWMDCSQGGHSPLTLRFSMDINYGFEGLFWESDTVCLRLK